MSSPGGTACQRQLRIRGQVSHLSVLFFHPQQGPTTCPPRLKGELSLALSYPKWKQRRRDTDRTSTVPLFVLKSTSALRLSVESWPSDDEGCSLWPLSLRQGTTSTLPIRSLPPGTVQGQTQPGLELNGLENTGICLSLSCSWLAISSCILPDSRSCPGGGGGGALCLRLPIQGFCSSSGLPAAWFPVRFSSGEAPPHDPCRFRHGSSRAHQVPVLAHK